MFKVLNRIIVDPCKWIWEKTKCISNNAYGMLLLLFGIGVIAFSMVAALSTSGRLLPVVISAVGTFFGTFIITRAMRRFSKSFFNDESKELLNANQAKLDAELELQNETARRKQAEHDLEAANDEIRSLKHQRSISSDNVGLIYPSRELIVGKLPFHITDFYNLPIGNKPIVHSDLVSKLPFVEKFNMTKEFYRGVYERSGVLNFSINLSEINIFETENEILVCGPFAYRITIDADDHREWKMRGRCEREVWEGSARDKMKIVSVEVTELNNEKWQKKQEQDVQKRITGLDKIDVHMKSILDQMVFGSVEAMLLPTKKKIRFMPDLPEEMAQEKLMTLNDFISDFNRRMMEDRKALTE